MLGKLEIIRAACTWAFCDCAHKVQSRMMWWRILSLELQKLLNSTSSASVCTATELMLQSMLTAMVDDEIMSSPSHKAASPPRLVQTGTLMKGLPLLDGSRRTGPKYSEIADRDVTRHNSISKVPALWGPERVLSQVKRCHTQTWFIPQSITPLESSEWLLHVAAKL